MQKSHHISLSLIASGLLVIAFVLIYLSFSQRLNSIETYLVQAEMKKEATPPSPLVQRQDDIVSNIASVRAATVTVVANANRQYYYEQSFSLFNNPGITQEVETTLTEGNGMILTQDGYIVTNRHVVADTSASYHVILADGSQLPVENIRFDPYIDLAILKITPDGMPLQTVTLPQNDYQPAIGQFVFAVGSTDGQWQHGVRLGVLSARKAYTTINQKLFTDLLQTDVTLAPGNSGGPLIDIQGTVIGMNTAKVQSSNDIGLAIPLTDTLLAGTIGSISSNGKIVRATLPVTYTDITPREQQEMNTRVAYGAYVETITAADNNELAQGDVIVAVNNADITPTNPLLSHLYGYQPGDIVTLTVVRNGDTRTVRVQLQAS